MVLNSFIIFDSQYGKTGSKVSGLLDACALETVENLKNEEALEADQTLEALETLMAVETLPKLSNLFVAGGNNRVVPDWRVLQSFGQSPPSGELPLSGLSPRLGKVTIRTGLAFRLPVVRLQATSLRTQCVLLPLGSRPSCSHKQKDWPFDQSFRLCPERDSNPHTVAGTRT